MSATADLVYQNFVWRIETLSPTSTLAKKGFTFNNRPLNLIPDQSSGMTREFTLYWEGSDPDHAPTDITERTAEHSFMLDVAYSTKLGADVLFPLMLADRHDLMALLRDTAGYRGYNASNTNTDLFLWRRWHKGDVRITASDTTWYLRQNWICTIREGE
jgi:hypothetical protein